MIDEFEISIIHGRDDNKPVRLHASWQDVVDSLTDVEEAPCTLADCLRSDCPHKNGDAWLPAVWPEGARRLKHLVERVSLFVVDLDHLTQLQLDEVLERISDLKYFMHASHSDRPGDRHVRVALVPSRPILGVEFDRFYVTAVEMLALPGDKNAKDAGRLFYMPSRPRDGLGEVFDGSGFDFAENDGVLLDVDAIMAKAPPERPVVQAAIPKFTGAPSQEAYAQAVEILGDAWPESGHRHGAQLALAGALARAGWPVELIGQFICDVSERRESGAGELDKRLKTAEDTLEKLQAGEAVKGWPKLEEDVDPAAVLRARVLLGMALPEPDAGVIAAFGRSAQKNVERRHAAAKRVEEEIRERAAERALSPRAAIARPTRLMNVEALRGIAKDLKKHRDVAKRHDGALLHRVIRGDALTDGIEEDLQVALESAAILVARGLLPGSTSQDVADFILPSSGGLSSEVVQIATWAADAAREAGPIETRRSSSRRLPPPDEEPNPESDEELREMLEMSPMGDSVRPVGHNIEKILRFSSDTRDHLRFNEVTRQVEVTGGRFGAESPNGLPVGVMNWLSERWQLATSADKVAEQLLRVAQLWYSYDPVAEYLTSLEWDGVPRLGSAHQTGWLTRYCNVPDTSYARRVGARFLLSAVARGLSPGCQVDTLLILEGAQGAKKSTTIRILGHMWFSDTPLVLGDKDSMMVASVKWIVELAELDSLARGEVTRHKAFLSAPVDNFRPPYGRTMEEFKRRCVFFGSVNDQEYLQDPTGNRRYWAVRVGQCDESALRRDRDQLWAEAVYRYQTAELNPDQAHDNCPGERWWFEPAEQIDADVEVASRCYENPWGTAISMWADKQGRSGGRPHHVQCTLLQVAEQALNLSKSEAMRNVKLITRALRDAGFESSETQQGRVWTRSSSTPVTPCDVESNHDASISQSN